MASEKTLLAKANGHAPAKKSPVFPYWLFPEAVQPYLELLRLHRPSGLILIFWPFAWGLTMAAYHAKLPLDQYWTELGKFVIAAFVVRGSACTINDIFDREYDAGVERTKNRPLASGRISVFAAYVYLIFQYLVGIYVYRSYNSIGLTFALIQLLPLFIVYPLMKRITYWPQAWLGIAMNFSLVVGWTVVTSEPYWRLLGAFMLGGWGFTMHYDTIYACQDRKDDIKVGVKSTAVMLGDHVLPFTMVCSMLFVGMLAYAGMLNGQTSTFFTISVGGSAAHLIYQYATVDLEVGDSCARNFTRCAQMGWITWGGMMLDYLARIDKLPFALPF